MRCMMSSQSHGRCVAHTASLQYVSRYNYFIHVYCLMLVLFVHRWWLEDETSTSSMALMPLRRESKTSFALCSSMSTTHTFSSCRYDGMWHSTCLVGVTERLFVQSINHWVLSAVAMQGRITKVLNMKPPEVCYFALQVVLHWDLQYDVKRYYSLNVSQWIYAVFKQSPKQWAFFT